MVTSPHTERRPFDRPPSVPEIKYDITNGDAFFADYTVIASLTHRF